MRNKIIAGNWKMNKTFDEGVMLINNILSSLDKDNTYKKNKSLRIVLAPPFTLLNICTELTVKYTKVFTSAQNCHYEDKGAFTGEISAPMIKSSGASYVIIGHSERRLYFNEDNLTLAKKINSALKSNLLPIFCCGESLNERQAGNHFNVVKTQLNEALFNLTIDDFKYITIAYEPLWAIGTGLNATPQQAQEMHSFIRTLVRDKYNQTTANNTSILYGGSCNAKNAKELFANPDVDGGLIGGASLIAEDFVKIINSL